MSDSIITVQVDYNIKTDKFNITGNAKNPKDIIQHFLRSQYGTGVDNNTPNNYEVYSIKLDLDLAEDIFTVSHNCGNKGLREGILLQYCARH